MEAAGNRGFISGGGTDFRLLYVQMGPETNLVSCLNGFWRLFAWKFDGQLNNQIHLIFNTKYKSTPYIWFLAQWVIKLRKPITNKNVWNLEFLSSWAPMGDKYQKKKKYNILTNHKNNWLPPRWILIIVIMKENQFTFKGERWILPCA
jgi:hypothetical protein